jgi:hypothetical protein
VSIALAEHFKFGAASAVIVRRAGARSNDIVVLPETAATPEALASAAMMLHVLMDRDGDEAKHDGLFRVALLPNLPSRELAAASRILVSIHGQSKHGIEGIGEARVGVMFLPDSTARANRKTEGKLKIHAGG